MKYHSLYFTKNRARRTRVAIERGTPQGCAPNAFGGSRPRSTSESATFEALLKLNFLRMFRAEKGPAKETIDIPPAHHLTIGKGFQGFLRLFSRIFKAMNR